MRNNKRGSRNDANSCDKMFLLFSNFLIYSFALEIILLQLVSVYGSRAKVKVRMAVKTTIKYIIKHYLAFSSRFPH